MEFITVGIHSINAANITRIVLGKTPSRFIMGSTPRSLSLKRRAIFSKSFPPAL